MPLPTLLFAALILAQADEPPVTVRGYPWAPFISPMGEPFRAVTSGEAPIARWFAGADRNRDGALTAAELEADAARFFLRLDDNGDGQIDREELVIYETQIAPEIQVNSNWRRARGETPPEGRQRGKDDEHDGYRLDGLQGAARYGLLNIPQPVAGADADFNRAVSLAEFRQAAANRFRLLDRNNAGRIGLAELEARLPTRPRGKAKRPGKDALDQRIGTPLPEGR